MQTGFLIGESGSHNTRKIPVGLSLVVGRTADCGFIIDDVAASRRHVEVLTKPEGFFWKDLGSTNGTLLNGARMLEGRLRHGDLIQIGETMLRFVVEEVPDQGIRLENSTIFKHTIIDLKGRAQKAEAPPGKSDHLLKAVYKVMNEIATNYEPCSLVDSVLETTMQAIDAQRGAVFCAGQAAGELLPCSACGHVHVIENGVLRRAETDEIRVSHTVANRVLNGGESVLYLDSDHDAELNMADSIMALKLRSIICVPLRGKLGISGILYMDSNRPGKEYTHDDMLLSTAVGNSAGLAIENAKMHRQILEKQRIEQEIEYAWTIQESFLVKEWPSDDARFEVFGETRPAKTIGGDSYDFVRPDPDTVGLLISDVSGKGVPAALSMAQLLAEFRLHAMSGLAPLEVLRRLNQGLVSRSQRGMFCTLCYSTLNLITGKLITANAGHHPILCIGAQGTRFLSEASGPPAGILPDAHWVETEDAILPGEMLLLYTDGLVEAYGPATQHAMEPQPDFGAEGLLRAAQSMRGHHPRELVRAINQSVRQFCAPSLPHDDCTMIALRFLG